MDAKKVIIPPNLSTQRGAVHFVIDSNQKKNGPYEEWYFSGKRFVECYYKDNKLDGHYRKYYETGGVMEERTYSNGLKHGAERSFDRNAQMNYVCEYRNNLRDGYEMSFYPSGPKRDYNEYKEGKLHGRHITWNECGSLYMENNYNLNKMESQIMYQQGNKKEVERQFKKDYVRVRIFRVDESLIYDYIHMDEMNKSVMITANDDKGRNCALGEGDIEVWKAGVSDLNKFVIIKLVVPRGSRRVTPMNVYGLSRVEYGIVVQIMDESGKEYSSAKSPPLVYALGEMVVGKGYNDDIELAFGGGINVHKHPDHVLIWKKNLLLKN
ncbi:MAG: hypothetical protein Harvfovirus15_25 [Harvfovirus sp.]|uniref:MORN repeat-containing protein n=1 Tax=Harvfovirus sp. TaxID=2487768 RepID=A0A3G5A4D6_9VIRU|nr:MAG: hypothetical protein Harvfovirus15_25 [Harvfovirus sp.]